MVCSLFLEPESVYPLHFSSRSVWTCIHKANRSCCCRNQTKVIIALSHPSVRRMHPWPKINWREKQHAESSQCQSLQTHQAPCYRGQFCVTLVIELDLLALSSMILSNGKSKCPSCIPVTNDLSLACICFAAS